MELKAVQALMHEFENSNTRELKIDDGDFHLYLSKNQDNTTQGQIASAPTKSATTPEPAPVKANTKTITAPLVGTVYLQPKPGAKPYAQVGDHVKAGDVVCVIEAMKMMTEIKSDVTGTITKVNVDNEELVEVEQPLFTVAEEEKHD